MYRVPSHTKNTTSAYIQEDAFLSVLLRILESVCVLSAECWNDFNFQNVFVFVFYGSTVLLVGNLFCVVNTTTALYHQIFIATVIIEISTVYNSKVLMKAVVLYDYPLYSLRFLSADMLKVLYK